MKKIVFTLAALMTMTIAFAEDNAKTANAAVNDIEADKYSININLNSLSYALGLDIDERNDVRYIDEEFSENMAKAAQANGEERDRLFRKAVNRDLAYMHAVLSNEQYHRYVALLNTTLNNRGLNK